MKLIIDADRRELVCEDAGKICQMPLYSKEAFEWISRYWVKVGWDLKYSYSFTWLGRPVVQLPEDMIRIQELIYRVKPDMIIETGVAHGGSLIFYASLCKTMGKGKVVGIDIEIREHNRRAIEKHELADWITLIVGNSTSSGVIEKVKAMISPKDTVLVILDSCHTKDHVLKELESYHACVTPGSYLVATDGIMKDLSDVPNGRPEWVHDNPQGAVEEFVRKHPEFTLEKPGFIFNESKISEGVTYWPQAYLRKSGSKG